MTDTRVSCACGGAITADTYRFAVSGLPPWLVCLLSFRDECPMLAVILCYMRCSLQGTSMAIMEVGGQRVMVGIGLFVLHPDAWSRGKPLSRKKGRSGGGNVQA